MVQVAPGNRSFFAISGRFRLENFPGRDFGLQVFEFQQILLPSAVHLEERLTVSQSVN